MRWVVTHPGPEVASSSLIGLIRTLAPVLLRLRSEGEEQWAVPVGVALAQEEVLLVQHHGIFRHGNVPFLMTLRAELPFQLVTLVLGHYTEALVPVVLADSAVTPAED